MPHTRRAEVSYEEHAEDCYDNRWNVLDEQQTALEESREGGGDRSSGPPVYEQFALRCRWGRVDSFVSEVSLVETLSGFVHAGMSVCLSVCQTVCNERSPIIHTLTII